MVYLSGRRVVPIATCVPSGGLSSHARGFLPVLSLVAGAVVAGQVRHFRVLKNKQGLCVAGVLNYGE